MKAIRFVALQGIVRWCHTDDTLLDLQAAVNFFQVCVLVKIVYWHKCPDKGCLPSGAVYSRTSGHAGDIV